MESDFCSLFLAVLADNRTRFVRQSQNKIRPEDFRQDTAPILERASNLRESKKRGATPSAHARVQSVGLA